MSDSRWYGVFLAGALGVVALVQVHGAQPARLAQAAPPARETLALDGAPWVEPDMPFFSSVLDARQAGDGFPADNLTPRALILQLGHTGWAAFDVDLLRMSAIWHGEGVTPKGLAPGSYHAPERKTPGGQSPLPEPDGSVWLASGLYAGWQAGDRPSLSDPREPAPSPEEVGRGPLPGSLGRFGAVTLVAGGAVLEYTVEGTRIRERTTARTGLRPGGAPTIARHVEAGPARQPLWLVLGVVAEDVTVQVSSHSGAEPSLETLAPVPGSSSSLRALRVPPREEPARFTLIFAPRGETPGPLPWDIPTAPPPARWPQEIVTPISRADATDQAYVVDDIALPASNPWRRHVRMSDIQFLSDGTGVGVTLDGDVWIIRGLDGTSRQARWSRFASGLHEPLTLAVRDDELFVFDRNGIWRLRDTSGNGEADVHELFSNAFAQTADMREFPNTLRLAPGGTFVIAKGGQEAATIGKHNGSVLQVSADGRTATVLGYGLRQPNIGVNLRTGMVTASDQQGHYVPSTPLHIVRDRQFYGFVSTTLPPETYPTTPVADPLTWIPHSVNASGVSQVWLFDARMGPLNDALVHIGFNRPEVFRVLINPRTRTPQASVVSITSAFDFPPLNGAVNPADGQLYLAGFQILGWGTTATRLAGLGRVRYTGAPSTLPHEISPMDTGVLLRFDEPLDPDAATSAASYTVSAWHYQRSHRYGSPRLQADGTPGVETLAPTAAYLSDDRRSVFVAVPGLAPVMQLEIGWALTAADGRLVQGQAYTTPYELPAFTPAREGFGPLTIDLAPQTTAAEAPVRINATVEEGQRVYQAYGCAACHAASTAEPDRLGPSFAGLYGARRVFADGSPAVIADEVYLRESILQPSAAIVAGYEVGGVGMPSYAGVLSDEQVASVILFIKNLQ
jgi:mono/diheme cytochrome c family protein